MSLQPHRRDRSPKIVNRAAAVDVLVNTEDDALENVQTTLPLRDTRNILGVLALAAYALLAARGPLLYCPRSFQLRKSTLDTVTNLGLPEAEQERCKDTTRIFHQ